MISQEWSRDVQLGMNGQMLCIQKCGERMVRRQFKSVCFLLLNNITMKMVPGVFEVKVTEKEKCPHFGFLYTRLKVK